MKITLSQARAFGLPYWSSGIAWRDNSNIAVCGQGSHVHVYSQDGQEHTPPAHEVWNVAWRYDSLFVTEYNTQKGRVFVYSKAENRSTTTELEVGYRGRGGLAVTNRYMYVTSSEENLVYRLDSPDGANRRIFVKSDAGLSSPEFIAASNVRVAVSSRHSHTVVVFDTEGSRLFVYGGPGDGPGQLSSPLGVAFVSNDRILVSDHENHRISVISSRGRHIKDVISADTGLYNPRGIDVSGMGQVVICFDSPEPTVIVYNIA